MDQLNKAVSVLKKGGVVIVPTDTVYGIIAPATNKKAVAKIYNIKKRPKAKPLPVFVSGVKMAGEIAEVDVRAKKMFKKYWPGKYTFVLKRKIQNAKVKATTQNSKLYGVAKNTIALRMPKNTFLLTLLRKIGHPLVQTSANISGQEPLNSIEQIRVTFHKNRLVGLIIDGGVIRNAKSSKIIDLTGQKIVILR